MTSITRKTQALLAAAKAFMARGPWVQYDQLSMDRILRVTPRHDWLCTPEHATEQHTVYMDCARFVCTLFYAAFGVRLEADVTWNMIKTVKDRVYYRQLTLQETPQEHIAIWEEICQILEPGDAIVFLRGSRRGHIVLYMGNGVICESAGGGPTNSYCYADRHDTVRETGLYTRTLQQMFDEHLEDDTKGVFSTVNTELAVLRPLNHVGEPTDQALVRIGQAKDLFCQVLSSHPGGMSLRRGRQVTYTVCVRNDGSRCRTVTALVNAPAGARLQAEAEQSCSLGAGESVCFAYPLQISEDCGAVLPPPQVQVNGLKLWAPGCLVEGDIPAEELAACAKRLEALLPQEPDLMKAACKAYAPWGLFRPSSEETLRYLYWRWNAACADVLWRDPQKPERMGVCTAILAAPG